MWFVTEGHTKTLEGMAQVMRRVGGRLHYFPVFEAGGADILEATEIAVLNDLRALQQEIEEITSKKKLSDRQLVTRRKKLAEKLQRIEVIEDLLQIQSVKVQDAAEAVAQAMVEDVKTESTPEPKPESKSEPKPAPVVKNRKRDTSIDFEIPQDSADPF